jgi:hypothetical protein
MEHRADFSVANDPMSSREQLRTPPDFCRRIRVAWQPFLRPTKSAA